MRTKLTATTEGFEPSGGRVSGLGAHTPPTSSRSPISHLRQAVANPERTKLSRLRNWIAARWWYVLTARERIALDQDIRALRDDIDELRRAAL